MTTRVHHLLRQKGREVVTVPPHLTVYRCIAVMVEHNVGSVVVSNGTSIEGIFTERDYLRRIALKGRTSRTTRVYDVMTAPVITVSPSQTVEDCLQRMTEAKCRHLPVVENDRLSGIISIGDCVKALLDDAQHEVEALEGFITGQYPR